MRSSEELHETVPGPISTVLRPSESSLRLEVRSVDFLEVLRPYCVNPVSEGKVTTGQAPAEHHWTKHERWPVAHVRASAPGAASIQLRVIIDGPGGFSGERWVQAMASHATLAVKPACVRFEEGSATAMLELTGLPTQVESVHDLTLTWCSADAEQGGYAAFQETRHTLYFVNARPCQLRPRLYADILRWSCEWAKGESTEQGIFAAIWKQFSPVQAEHPTRLQYWVGSPLASDLDRVVEHMALGRRGVQCVGLSQLLMGCLAVHGMPSVQVTLKTDASVGTTPLGKRYLLYEGRPYLLPDTWTCAARQALGTAPFAPERLGSHTVAAVLVGGQWLLCDPSYGIGPFALPQRLIGELKAGAFDLPFGFVQTLVQDFSCVPLHSDGNPAGPAVLLKPLAEQPFPRLTGQAANSFE